MLESRIMREEVITRLVNTVVNYDVEGAASAARKALTTGVDPVEAIEEGLAKGIRIVGDKFGAREIFLPELMVAVEAMRQAMMILEPAMTEKARARKKSMGKVMIGTVQGDIHDIGKSIINAMLTVAGFDVIDLGSDVSVETFVEKAKENQPDVIGMSALMTTSMLMMETIIKALRREGINKVVIVGGAPTSKDWAEKIGADGYGGDAMEAVEITKRLMTPAQ